MVTAVALAHAPGPIPLFRSLDETAVSSARLGTVCWTAVGPTSPPRSLKLPAQQPLEGLVQWLTIENTLQWRQSPISIACVPPQSSASSCGDWRSAPPPGTRCKRTLSWQPHFPQLAPGVADRLKQQPVWVPLQTRLLWRHVTPPWESSCSPTMRLLRLAATSTASSVAARPALPGYRFRVLGSPGRAVAGRVGTGGTSRRSRSAWFQRTGAAAYVEPLLLGRPVPLTTTCCSPASTTRLQRSSMTSEASGISRRIRSSSAAQFASVPYGLDGLVRVVDLEARRHRYGIGDVPEGMLAGELGALLSGPTGDCVALFVDDEGWISTSQSLSMPREHVAEVLRARLLSAARWTVAPLTWRGFSRPAPRLRATARRARDSARIIVRTPFSKSMACPARPAGYLLREPSQRNVPLYHGTHPVTGDELLSNREAEPGDLGYKNVTLLGHLVAVAPLPAASVRTA